MNYITALTVISTVFIIIILAALSANIGEFSSKEGSALLVTFLFLSCQLGINIFYLSMFFVDNCP